MMQPSHRRLLATTSLILGAFLALPAGAQTAPATEAPVAKPA